MDLDMLRRHLQGDLIDRGHPDYDVARRVWNGVFDRHPIAVVRCTSAADVAAGVRFARSAGLPLAIRGGGHSMAGLSTCDDGLVLDLRLLDGVEVDATARTAAAGAGNTWATYDAATQGHGLASPGGEVSGTGIAGLTLGGGIGWLSRHHGLACDNLLSAEVVTADGEVVVASATEHPDLFWALRGGGGNFGVVTRFTYTVHPLPPPVPVAIAIHREDDVAEALRMVQDWALAAPDEVGLNVALITAPPLPSMPPDLHGRRVAVVVACWSGDPGDAAQHLSPLLRAGTPAVAELTAMPYTALQSMVDEAVPPGVGSYVKSEFLQPLHTDAIAGLLDGWSTASSPMNQVLLRLLGGAIVRVPADETAFAHRDGTWMLTVAAMWPDPAEDQEPHARWARAIWQSLLPSSTGGTYVNHLAADDALRRQAAYDAATWERLVEVKTTWDPENLFRLNQNVPPRAALAV